MTENELNNFLDWWFDSFFRVTGMIVGVISIFIGFCVAGIKASATGADEHGAWKTGVDIGHDKWVCPKFYPISDGDTGANLDCTNYQHIHNAIWTWNIIWWACLPLALTLVIPIVNYGILSYRGRKHRAQLRESQGIQNVLEENRRLDDLLKQIDNSSKTG